MIVFHQRLGYAGTQSPLTTNQDRSSGWVLPVSTTRKKEMEFTTHYVSWPRQGPKPSGDRRKKKGLVIRFSSWAAVSRSRGRSAPCPLSWVICSRPFFLQSDLAGERSQFATENKTASERTFLRFFSTKHESVRRTVGRWLPKETPIRSAPCLGGIYLISITRRGSL